MSVSALSKASAQWANVSHWVSTASFGAKAQIAMLEDLISLTKEGVQINRAVDEIIDSARGAATEAARSMKVALAKGRDLSEGMVGWFDPALCDAVRAGVRTGAFEEAVTAGLSVVRTRSEAVSHLIKAMIYPTVVFLAATAFVLLMALYILPEMQKVVPAHKWTDTGRGALAIGSFVATKGVYLLIALSLVIGTTAWSFGRFVHPLRAQLDAIPPWTWYRRYQSAAFMLQLSLLLESGVKMKDALSLLSARANPYLRGHISEMRRKLEGQGRESGGKSVLAGALNTGLIEVKDSRRLHLYAQTKSFEAALSSMGKNAIGSVAQVMHSIAGLLSTAVLILGGGLLAYMGVGLFQTLQSIGQ